jgi:hypothetical protein
MGGGNGGTGFVTVPTPGSNGIVFGAGGGGGGGGGGQPLTSQDLSGARGGNGASGVIIITYFP